MASQEIFYTPLFPVHSKTNHSIDIAGVTATLLSLTVVATALRAVNTHFIIHNDRDRDKHANSWRVAADVLSYIGAATACAQGVLEIEAAYHGFGATTIQLSPRDRTLTGKLVGFAHLFFHFSTGCSKASMMMLCRAALSRTHIGWQAKFRSWVINALFALLASNTLAAELSVLLICGSMPHAYLSGQCHSWFPVSIAFAIAGTSCEGLCLIVGFLITKTNAGQEQNSRKQWRWRLRVQFFGPLLLIFPPLIVRIASFHPALFETDPSLSAATFFTVLSAESAICNIAAHLMSYGSLMTRLAFRNGGLGDQTSSHELAPMNSSYSCYATQTTLAQSKVGWGFFGNGKGGDIQAGLEDDGSQKGIVARTDICVDHDLSDETPHEQYNW